MQASQPQTLPGDASNTSARRTGSKEVEVRARVTGILEKRLFQEGASVKAGQPLFVIDPQAAAGADRRGRRPRSRARRRRRRRPSASWRG